jgi:hypothetical protein
MATKTKEYSVTGTDGKDYSVTATASGEVNVTSVKPLSTDPIPPEPEPGPEPDTNTIPLSFDDPMFTDMTEKSSCMTLSTGQDLSKHSIQETSGEPSIVCHGNNSLSHVRVKSRECIRITDDELIIENAYLEAKGTGDDHADTLQAYCPGARGASVTLRNTHVRAYNEAATAGYFTADNWDGTITCENVIFQGGPFGLRPISDPGCNIDVYMRDVFFVGPFGYDPFSFEEYGGGVLTIKEWRNVRNASIVDGKLVPGNEMAMPSKTQMAAPAKAPRPVRNASTGYTVAK